MTNVVIYARYSSDKQTEQSIEGQLRVCHEYCKQNDFNVVKEYIDRALSGTTENRPEFQRMISDSEKKQFQYVIVYQLDRFSRNRYISIRYKNKLEMNGVRVISTQEPISEDAYGIIVESLIEGMNEYYSAELAQKVRRGLAESALKLQSTGGGISLGYKVVDKKYQIDPKTAPIVRIIFDMYAEGKTVTEIVDYLNGCGYKTSKGVPFNKNSLHALLKNKRYIGVYTFKGRETKNAIPRIVSDEQFAAVQEILERNKKARAHSKAKEEYLLTTKLYCGYCKKMMTGFSGTGKQGKVYRYYICNGTKERPKTCDKKRINKNYIEDLVVRECRRLLSAENIRRIAKEVMAMVSAEKDTSELKRLKKLLAENERKQKNTIDAITESDMESVRKALGAKIPELEIEHKELEGLIAKEEEVYPTLTEEEILFFLNSLKKGRVDDIKYRKMLISVFVNRIYLYDDRITITFNSGDKPVTVNDEMLSDLEAREEEYKALFDKDRVLFFAGSGPPPCVVRLENILPRTQSKDTLVI